MDGINKILLTIYATLSLNKRVEFQSAVSHILVSDDSELVEIFRIVWFLLAWMADRG